MRLVRPWRQGVERGTLLAGFGAGAGGVLGVGAVDGGAVVTIRNG